MVGQYDRKYAVINKRPVLGFTIVELLIVIVVIGILAAITIVAFSGVQNRARVATVQSDLNAVSKRLKIDQTLGTGYPTTLASANSGAGVPASTGTSYQYSVDNTANPQTFCVTAVNGGIAYFISESTTVSAGTCPGHSATGAPAPVIAGYYDFSSYNVPLTGIPLPTIPDGAWMMIVMAYNNSVDVIPPTGWSTLYGRITANTMQTMIFSKIKTSSEPATFSLTGSFAPTTTNGVIFWGTGASSDMTSWIKGASVNRNGTAAQQYTTTTPTITTTVNQSLVLSVSTERTTLIESDIVSLTGATRWFFVPQPDSSKIQTITLSTATLATPATTVPVVVTYPNPQIYNGTALQIALPPA